MAGSLKSRWLRGLGRKLDKHGLNKPYMDGQGRIWVKNGADKRQVTAREEMQRMFQESGLIHADELPVGHCQVDDLDQAEFSRYFERRYGKPVSSVGIPFEQLLQNLNLARSGTPNLTGMLLFGKSPSNQLPAFVVKAVAFPGNVLHDMQYLDSEDIDGTLPSSTSAASPLSKEIFITSRASRALTVPVGSKYLKKYLKRFWSTPWCTVITSSARRYACLFLLIGSN